MLFANVSANNVNSKSIHFSYDDITEYKGDNPYVYVNDNKPYFTGSEIKDECYLKYGPLDSLKRGTSAIACINYDSILQKMIRKVILTVFIRQDGIMPHMRKLVVPVR